jgi:hypothetical protein
MKKISIKKFILIAIGSMVLSATAQASVLSSGLIYGNNQQKYAICYIYNVGSTAIKINSKAIIHEFDGSVPTDYGNSCGSSLGAGKTCIMGAHTVVDRAYACKIDVSSPTTTRATFMLQDGFTNILNTDQLR